MAFIAYSIEIAALVVSAALLNIHNCPGMAWTMLVLSMFVSVQSETTGRKGGGK